MIEIYTERERERIRESEEKRNRKSDRPIGKKGKGDSEREIEAKTGKCR